MTVVETKKGILVFPPVARDDWYEAVAQVLDKSSPQARVVGIGVDVPKGVQAVLRRHGAGVASVPEPTISALGTVSLPPELAEVSETIPGRQVKDLPCQPVLSIFPDAAPTEWEGRRYNVGDNQSFPDLELICERLKAANRYFVEDSDCAGQLKLVNIEWREDPGVDNAPCWDNLVGTLKAAKARGIQINLKGTEVRGI